MIVSIKVLPQQGNYGSAVIKSMRSRSWQAHEGCSFKIVNVVRQKLSSKADTKQTEESKEAKLEAWRKERAARARARKLRGKERRGGFGDFLPDVSLIYNISNDPCLKYTTNLIADRGTDPHAWTSNRLKNEVIYLETERERYELSVASPAFSKENPSLFDKYRWARVQNPQQLNRHTLEGIAVPLKTEHIDVIHSDLDWADVKWTANSIVIRDTTYSLSRMFWAPVRLQ
eukprot:Opistho-2@38093